MFKLIFGAAAAAALIGAALVGLSIEHHAKGHDALRPAADRPPGAPDGG